ncbi:MAG TPA: DUF3536 domain-containing protein [Thermoanaerobaculia bacterium]|jgi:alpha-amylase/alpha-mannosidase (GH57 family)|nr:DUF3536 domain-containing protein [Thermoanaerobaculia bacterium]
MPAAPATSGADRFVCIHGHFYQPPRENPWLEAIERQPSAWPYHDWNERISAECYAPNARARVLDERGRLVRLVDNYSRISFNFGPTLLAWMERADPETYAAILAADRKSVERSGHGAALAQVHGHLILPLANARDKRTQVLWGIADFRHRFGRAPEGMWLPETAVDVATLEVLAECGIRFTILAPHQAARVRPIGEKAWGEVPGASIDPSRAYSAVLPSGREIALFFYDGPLSRSIAFEGMLHNGDLFAERLAGAFPSRPGAKLVHVATDGESYGHHHRHGEMALAATLLRLEGRGLARVVHYGEFLAAHPPEWQVEIVPNTSWSCAHGIERWRSDCGCNAGGGPGWNQSWRAPLRRALDELRDRLALRYERAASDFLSDPWRARDAYIGVVLDRSPAALDRFLAAEARRPLAGAERVRVRKLLELERQAMAMYTSCGWFFSDLAGIETRQVLLHAGRAIELAEELFGEPFEPAFLDALAAARSNDPAFGDGRAIYQASVKPAKVALSAVAAHDAIAVLFSGLAERAESAAKPEPGVEEGRIYAFAVARRTLRRGNGGPLKLLVAEVDITSEITGESGGFTYAAFAWGDPNVQVGVRPRLGPALPAEEIAEVEEALRLADPAQVVRWLDRRFPVQHALDALFGDDRERLLERILRATIDEVEGKGRELFERHAPLMRRLAGVGLALPGALRSAAEMAIHAELKHALRDGQSDLAEIRRRLIEVRDWGLVLDREGVRYLLESAMTELAERLRRDPLDAGAAIRLEALLDLAGALPFPLDHLPPQVALYWLFAERADLLVEMAEEDRAGAEGLARLERLAERLSIRL